ncbi:amino acid adenylation domain-containing protein, partial [Pedobacter sp. UYP1]|uniref:amino acid adenylation domain-containing protein n=1 Tax=Pedobacter sp. UYP1 TaxID=1756396 RepID=UPI00339B274C
LDQDLFSRFHVILQQQGVTLFMGLLAAVNALLYRYSGQEDIIIGSPVAGREHIDLEDQIGFYVNTLALRTRFTGEDSYQELLHKVKEVTLSAYEHQEYPFDLLIDELKLQRDLSRSALFDVMVVLDNNQGNYNSIQRAGDLMISRHKDGERILSKFDLTFNFMESGDQILLDIEYNTDLYEERKINQLASHFEELLSALTSNPLVPVSKLEYLSEKEVKELLSEFNATDKDYPKAQTVINLFEEQVERTPEGIAITFLKKTLSYRELNRLSNEFGYYLLENKDLHADDLIGICLERSEWLIIVMLGVLKSGVAYVPIDPAYPQERKEYILADSRCKVLVDENYLEAFRNRSHQYSRKNLKRGIQPSDLAYVIYTSGSTGKPKGCGITHHNLYNYIHWADDYYFNPGSLVNFGLYTSLSFDLTVTSIFCPLTLGGKLSVYHQDEEISTILSHSFHPQNNINSIKLTPSHINVLAHLNIPETSINCAIVGGEEITQYHIKILKKINPLMVIYNEYGPTEATVGCIVKVLEENIPVLIGKPIANTHIYILDKNSQLCPLGVTGEICISGNSLTRGYIFNPELSDSKFIRNPYQENMKMYCTGDLGSWLPDGNIVFLGRKDEQIKIRGYRIEPGEIEQILREYWQIEDAVVIARYSPLGGELIAYITGGKDLNIAEIRTYISKLLPVYMLPNYYVQLERLPLTINGKVDKNILPEPEQAGMFSGAHYIAPRNQLETRLVDIWKEILGKAQIGIKDHFFDLGGHSLKAIRLASQIRKEFEIELSLKDIFTNPFLEEQAVFIQQSDKSAYLNINKAELQDSYPLSSSQQRIWILSQLEEVSIAYNLAGIYTFDGLLDQNALRYAFEELISRHESLRTVFKVDEEGEIRQFILSGSEIGFHMVSHDLRLELKQLEKAAILIDQNTLNLFDLSSGPLLRVVLIQLADNQWIFTCTIHHIISDGWSMNVLVTELLLLYNIYLNAQENTLAPLSLQYKDYAVWQQEQLGGELFKLHQTYWLAQLSGTIPVLNFPGDRLRPAVKTYAGQVVEKEIDKLISGKFKALIHDQDATLFMGLLAVLNALLYSYGGQEDIIIGTPVAGRTHTDLEDQIGFYVNTLALRTKFKGKESYKDLLDRVKKVTLDAYVHQSYPFDSLIEELHLPRDLSRNVLFDVMLLVQHADAVQPEGRQLGNIRIGEYTGKKEIRSKFDFTFGFFETVGGLKMSIEYNSDIYNESSINRLAAHFLQLLESVVADPSVPVAELDYLSAAEQVELLETFNATAVSYPKDKTLVDLFEQQVVISASTTALVFEDREFSYAALNSLANQLGGYLRSTYEIQPDELVGICLERSEWMVIAILGVLKSGGAYVPIDPGYPQERIDYMLSDSQCKVVIDEAELLKFRNSLAVYSTENLERVNSAEDLAYVIYTSGSTGRPKGAMLEHAGVVNRIDWMWKEYGFSSSDIILQKTTFTFDVSVWEFFLPLCWGSKLVLCKREDIVSPERLLALIAQHQISCVHFVPSMFDAFISGLSSGSGLSGRLSGLRLVITSGEALSAGSVRSWYAQVPGVPVYNLYGPTEASVDVTAYSCQVDDLIIPIGRPIANTSIYIVNGSDHLQAVGIAGEICIGGDGLARGYLHNGVLTAEKFVANPFEPGERMYRTGDLGRWLEDGNIEYLGRLDDQVKIRGYRIELGEIEAALRSYPGVEGAVVTAGVEGAVVTAGGRTEKELVAYVVSQEELYISDLRVHLSRILPDYMLPAHFVQLDEIPLNANGKADRKSLPDPLGLELGTGIEYIAPRNKVEEQLVEIWGELLDKENISVKDSFFDLGGHSLKAIRLINQLYKIFEVTIVLKYIFETPVLEDLAELIKHQQKENFINIPQAIFQAHYPLSSSQRRLWILSQFAQGSIAYNMPGVFVFEGDLNTGLLEGAFHTLLERHEVLRTVFRETENGEIRQFILPAGSIGFKIKQEDLRGLEVNHEHIQL